MVATHMEALVRFRSAHDSGRAHSALHGNYIYVGCCLLDIHHMQPIPAPSPTTIFLSSEFGEGSATQAVDTLAKVVAKQLKSMQQ